jgi:NAD+ synthase
LDYDKTEREISQFIRETVKEARAKGVVLGLSGGIDSAVVAALCAKVLGKEKVVGLLMPSAHTPKLDLQDAADLAKNLGIKTLTIKIPKILEEFIASVSLEGSKIAKANAQARIRMALNYYVANTLNMLVAGTGDRSEDLIGYFTKYGDGGVDFLPIAHLYKTQVRHLGSRLGVPGGIVDKPSSPQLWPGHRAIDEIPLDYDILDLVLYCMFDLRMELASTTKKTGVSESTLRKVLQMHESSAHKRAYPPMVHPW